MGFHHEVISSTASGFIPQSADLIERSACHKQVLLSSARCTRLWLVAFALLGWGAYVSHCCYATATCVASPQNKKKNLCFAKVLSFGARCETWTHTISHTPLKRARLPIPPISHCLSIIVEIAQFVNCFFAKSSRNFQKSLQAHRVGQNANLALQATVHFLPISQL